MPVGDRQNLDDRLFFPVDDCKRKPLQDEFPGPVFAAGPTPRGRGYQIYGTIHFGDKVDGCGLISLLIPSHRGFEFYERRRVNFERLNGHD